MKILKFFTVMLLLMSFAQIVFAGERTPIRLARLPIILKSTHINTRTYSDIERQLDRAVHIPLNGTLQLVEYINPEDSRKTFQKVWHGKNIGETVKIFAKEIDADIVVCPIITRCSENHIPSLGNWHESRLSSNVSAELIVFDLRDDELVDKKTSRYYRGDYSKFGQAEYLASECFDELIKRTKLKEKIRAIQ